jgi:hypothetical protein
MDQGDVGPARLDRASQVASEIIPIRSSVISTLHTWCKVVWLDLHMDVTSRAGFTHGCTSYLCMSLLSYLTISFLKCTIRLCSSTVVLPTFYYR